MNKTIIAQMPPLGGGMMGGIPSESMPPGIPAPEKPQISGPLNSVGEILYDFNTEEYIVLHPNKDEETIAQDIWEAYGGNPDGSVDKNKTGKRTKESTNNPPEIAQKEREETEEKKWERLPINKNISDITSFDELIGLIKSLTYGTIKKYKAPAASPGGGMGLPGLASSFNNMKRNALVNIMKEELEKLEKYL